jgi:hypothetical protein
LGVLATLCRVIHYFVVRFGWFDLSFRFFLTTTLQLLDVVKYDGGKHFDSLLRDVVKQ